MYIFKFLIQNFNIKVCISMGPCSTTRALLSNLPLLVGVIYFSSPPSVSNLASSSLSSLDLSINLFSVISLICRNQNEI
jgi:hypothetical protein